MTAMRMGWGASARGALVLLGAALLGAAGWAGQAAAATAGTHAAAAALASPSASHPCGTQSKPGTIKHVIWIVLENHSYGAILGSSQASYFNTLAKDCGVATNYHNVTHPSLPNYIAATSGLPLSSLQEFLSDCSPSSSCDTSTQSIFGQGESWKAYEESMPSNCDQNNSGNYAVRHNPAVYYTSLRGCGSNDVSYSQPGQRPVAQPAARVLLCHAEPDRRHAQRDRRPGQQLDVPQPADDPQQLGVQERLDGRSSSPLTRAATWAVTPTARTARPTPRTPAATFPTFVISPSTKAGARSGTLFNHYSLLGTTEQLLHLSKLGRAASYPTMVSAFNL